ncbi:MAG TPA: hypothetical protein VF303_04920 [Candidatus Nanoarchaeia archaeon]
MNKPTSPSPAPTAGGKNITFIIIVVLVILVVFAAIWFVLTSLDTSKEPVTTTTTPAETVPQIQGADDLQKLEDQVRNTNVDNLSKDLDANEADAAEF